MAANIYPWCIVDACGDVVANFTRENIAYACRSYFDCYTHIEFRP